MTHAAERRRRISRQRGAQKRDYVVVPVGSRSPRKSSLARGVVVGPEMDKDKVETPALGALHLWPR